MIYDTTNQIIRIVKTFWRFSPIELETFLNKPAEWNIGKQGPSKVVENVTLLRSWFQLVEMTLMTT